MDKSAILLNCLNKDCSALILMLNFFSVVIIEDFVLFKICPLELISYGMRNTFQIALHSTVLITFVGVSSVNISFQRACELKQGDLLV